MIEAGVTGKLYENIISALKTEMDYHKMLGQEPKIAFLEDARLEIKDDKKLLIEQQGKNIRKKRK